MTRVLPHGAGLLFLRHAARRPLLPSYASSAVNYCQQARALHGTRFLGGGKKDHDGSASTTATKTSTEHSSSGGILGSLPARTALARVGHGVLVALPIAGAGFSAILARRDYHRTRKELKLARVRLTLAERNHQRDVSRVTAGKEDGVDPPTRPTLETSTTACFGVALAADSGIVAAHLVAAYGLYQGWAPDPVVNAEIASLIGAFVSTGGGVRGEYLVARRHDAELLERGGKGSDPRSNGGIGGEGGGGGGTGE